MRRARGDARLAPLFAVVLVAVLLYAVSAALAGVLVKNQATVSVAYAANPVQFQPGTNAGSPDFAGGTISVSVGPNGTTAQVDIKLTHGQVQYVDILRSANTGTQNFYIRFVISHDLPSTVVTGARLYVVNVTNEAVIDVIDFTASPTDSGWLATTLDADVSWRLDLVFDVAEGVSLPTTTNTIYIDLYYSPSNTENPVE